MKIRNLKLEIGTMIKLVALVLMVFSSVSPLVIPAVHAETPTIPADAENINQSSFRLLICDGPPIPAGGKVATPNVGHPYVACDFNGLMLQVQHFINIAIVLGVLVAIAGFCYAGFLYISGTQQNIAKAKAVFPKLFWGFIIMLTAWFIVYQILSWFTGPNSGFSTLIGTK